MKVMMYNGVIRWLVSTSKKEVLEQFFASSHRFPDIKYYDFKKLCGPETICKCHDAQH